MSIEHRNNPDSEECQHMARDNELAVKVAQHMAKLIRSEDGRAETGEGWKDWCIEAEIERDALQSENDRLTAELEEAKRLLQSQAQEYAEEYNGVAMDRDMALSELEQAKRERDEAVKMHAAQLRVSHEWKSLYEGMGSRFGNEMAEWATKQQARANMVTAERDRALSELDATRKALEEYGQHRQGCHFAVAGDGHECTCGLSAALTPKASA